MYILFQKDVLSNILELKRENDRKSEDCIALWTKDCAAFAHMHLILKGWTPTSAASSKKLNAHWFSAGSV